MFTKSQGAYNEMGCGRHVPSLACWVRCSLHMTGLGVFLFSCLLGSFSLFFHEDVTSKEVSLTKRKTNNVKKTRISHNNAIRL